MSVVDSLVVLLSLDSTKFTAGQKQAVQDLNKFTDQAGAAFEGLAKRQKRTADDERRQQNDRIDQNRKVADSYKGVTDQVLKFAATVVSTAAITNFVKGTIQMDAGLGRFADRLNLNKDQLALWTAMVAHMGVSTQQAAASVQGAASSLNQIRSNFLLTGDTSAMGPLSFFGMQMGQLNDPLQALQTLHQRVLARQGQGVSNGVLTSQLQALGLDAPMISLLEQKGSTFDQIRRQSLTEAPATAKQMEDAEKAAEAMSRLDNALHRIASDAAGPAAVFFTKMADLADEFPKETKALVEFVAGLVLVRTTLMTFGFLFGGGKAVAGAGAAAAGGGLGSLAGAGTIVGGSLALTGAVSTPLNMAQISAAIADPEHASDEGLKAAIMFARHQLQIAPADYKGAAARELTKLSQIGLARWGASGAGAVGAGVSSGSGSARSVRNNNPGNLTDPRTGAFRHFATPTEGFAAMAAQIMRDFNVHGLHTVAQLIGDPTWGWSPANARGNSAASTGNYISRVAKALGVNPNAQLSLNSSTITQLMNAMAALEAGPRGHAARIGQIGPIIINGAKDSKATAREVSAAVAQAQRGIF